MYKYINLQALGGRKFILTMLTGISTSVLVYLKSIPPEIYSMVTLGTVGAFIMGNSTESIKNKQAEVSAGKQNDAV